LIGTGLSLEATLMFVPPMSMMRIFMLIWILAMIAVWVLPVNNSIHHGCADKFVEFGIFAIEIGRCRPRTSDPDGRLACRPPERSP